MSGAVVLAAWGSIAMLGWSVAALVPVIIHLWFRRRQQEVSWAAMQYLLEAMRRHARRIRLEQLLLLGIRVAIPLVLAVALANPSIDRRSPLAAQHAEPQHVVLVLDVSYSMAHRTGTASRLQQAQQLARQLVAEAGEGVAMSLIVMADPPRVVVAPRPLDAASLLSEIDALTIQHTGADLQATLEQVRGVIREVRAHDSESLARQGVRFFTDLGSNTWDALAQPSLQPLIAELNREAEIRLVDVGNENEPNLAVTNLEATDELITTGRPIDYQVTVRSYADRDFADQRVDFFVDERLVASRRVSIPAGEQVRMVFSYPFTAAGEHRVEARLAADALDVDNARFLATPARDRLQVLCVSGAPGAARNVVLALEAMGERQPVSTEEVPDAEWGQRDLLSFDAVFLCNVGRFSLTESRALQEFVNAGGGLIVWLGDQVQPESYHALSIGDSSQPHLLPAHVIGVADPDQYSFDPRDYQHPMVHPFRGQEQAGLLTTPVWRYVRLEAHREPAVRTALWFRNGDPAIVEQQFGAGRTILVATAASARSVSREQTPARPWNAWYAWPSFPPLVERMLTRGAELRYADRNRAVGQPLRVASAAPEPGTVVSVSYRATAGWERRWRGRIGADGHDWSYDAADSCGFYRVEVPRSEDSGMEFAVNLAAPGESDLQRTPVSDLPGAWLTSEEQPPAAADPRGETPLFRLLLAVLLVLVLSEPLVARLVGRTPR